MVGSRRGAMGANYLIGNILTMIAAVCNFFLIFTHLGLCASFDYAYNWSTTYGGYGAYASWPFAFSMIADLIFAGCAVTVFVMVIQKYHTRDMLQMPAVFLAITIGSNLLRFGISFAYLIFLAPLGLMIVTIVLQDDLWGKITGGALILANIITAIVMYLTYHSSATMAGTMFNFNTLLGVAIILFYWKLPKHARVRGNVDRDRFFGDPNNGNMFGGYNNNGGYGGYGGYNNGTPGGFVAGGNFGNYNGGRYGGRGY